MIRKKGQVIIEFAFCMIIVLLMVYAITQILRWVGFDLTHRRITHDKRLTDTSKGTHEQIQPNFYVPLPMNAVFRD